MVKKLGELYYLWKGHLYKIKSITTICTPSQ